MDGVRQVTLHFESFNNLFPPVKQNNILFSKHQDRLFIAANGGHPLEEKYKEAVDDKNNRCLYKNVS